MACPTARTLSSRSTSIASRCPTAASGSSSPPRSMTQRIFREASSRARTFAVSPTTRSGSRGLVERDSQGVLMSEPTRREFLMTGLGAVAAAVPVVGQSQDLATLTLKQASDLIRRRTVSAVELTSACMKRIDAYNPGLNAFVTVAREQAL